MPARHSFLIDIASPLVLVSGACRRPTEPGAANRPSPAATAAPGAAPSAATSTTHPLSYSERLEIGALTPHPRPPPDNVKEIAVSHISIAFKGADRASAKVTRSKTQAKALADQVDRLARAGQDFGELALKYSDDPAVSASHGNLGKITRQQFDKPFTDAAFALILMEIGLDPVDTPAGFQIIRRTE